MPKKDYLCEDEKLQIRCKKCNRRLCDALYGDKKYGIVIRCPKCKTDNKI